MNTIDSVPDREPAERSTGRTTPDNSESARTAARSEPLGSVPNAAARTAVMDEAFVADLDARMAKSDLEELGWRDRSDIGAVLLDLERLAGASWSKAATLWDKYRPDDPDKPIFIDGDDKDPVTGGVPRRVVQRSPEPDEKKAGRDGADVTKSDEETRKVVVPKSVINRYLVAENKFYFRDDPNLLAFEDKGKRLATEHNDPQVAQSMVELAQAKHWNSIKVKGSDEFKREVWLAASLRGLEVQGYEPHAIDKARLAELRSEFQARHQNAVEPGSNLEKASASAVSGRTAESRRPLGSDLADDADNAKRNLTKQQRTAVATLRAILAERGDSAEAIEMATTLAAERFQQQRVYVGRLLAHGPAPYEHKPDEKPNYFVTLQTPEGKQTIWGLDLKRAVAVAKVAPGEDMALVHRGTKEVLVAVNERDQAGKLTGKQVEIVVHRNAWEVGKLDKMREEAQARVRAAAEQTAQNQPEVRVYDVPSPAARQASDTGKAKGREQSPPR